MQHWKVLKKYFSIVCKREINAGKLKRDKINKTDNSYPLPEVLKTYNHLLPEIVTYFPVYNTLLPLNKRKAAILFTIKTFDMMLPL